MHSVSDKTDTNEKMSLLTFEELPKAVGLVIDEVAQIKALLLALGNNSQSEPKDALLTVDEAATFLSLSKATIYTLISKGELPVMKRGKRCYFTKGDLLAYIKEGRQKTNAEIATIAANRTNKK